jgi:hypothetical protein
MLSARPIGRKFIYEVEEGGVGPLGQIEFVPEAKPSDKSTKYSSLNVSKL